jgi:NitT/TauT family transport system ATP-binding protein
VKSATASSSTPTASAPAETRARPPAIEFRGVRREFRLGSGARAVAVCDMDLTVEAGEFVCVLGPSGHGKTTMLNLIAGLLEPTAGEVLVAGAPVRGPGPDRGVVFQRDTLFLWRRVQDNIGFGLEARGVPKAQRREAVERLLDAIGMREHARSWPKQLSGGMRRRVAIAAVFANEPEVLLMDEPFVGLDYARRSVLHRVLLDLWERSRSTVFFITHDVDEAVALADRVLLVVDGRIAYETRLDLPRPRGAVAVSSAEAAALRTAVIERMQASVGERTA